MKPRKSGDPGILEANREFYDTLWTDARLVGPDPSIRGRSSALSSPTRHAGSRSRQGSGRGCRSRDGVRGHEHAGCFEAPGAWSECGARPRVVAPVSRWVFDLVCAFDIVEHVDDDDGALSELSRVAAPGATFLLSVPLHPSQWSAFDDFVGHRRRYQPEQLLEKLAEHGFSVNQSAVYGMQPKSSRLLDLGMWCLTHRREKAMWWYNHVFMPFGARFQKKLSLVPA